jgi:hypothetical protein
VLVGGGPELLALTKTYGSGSTASAIPGVAFSKWEDSEDSMTLVAGVSVCWGEGGGAVYDKASIPGSKLVNMISCDHLAAFGAALNTSIGESHVEGVSGAAHASAALTALAKEVSKSEIALATVRLQQQKDIQDAKLRDLGVVPGEDPKGERRYEGPDALDDSDQETSDPDQSLVISVVAEGCEQDGVEMHSPVTININALRKVVKDPVVTLMHAVVLAFQHISILSVYRSVCLSICLSIYTYLSIYLSI